MLPELAVKRYFHFVIERHAIYVRRQRGDAWPWTEDKILQTYKFTNVFRELDTGTIWLREHIREPLANNPELFFNIALYRRYNHWPFAGKLLGRFGAFTDYPKVVQEVVEFAKLTQSNGGQVFTAAHMINCPVRYKSKVDYVFLEGGMALWNARNDIDSCNAGEIGLEDVFDWLIKLSGIGPFIAYEIVTDLRHTRYLQDAPDINTWAIPGPGAQRGIIRMLGLPLKNEAGLPKLGVGYPTKPDGFIAIMCYLLGVHRQYLPKWVPDMELRDIEHSLCEFDKVERVRLGEGKPRSRYHHEE